MLRTHSEYRAAEDLYQQAVAADALAGPNSGAGAEETGGDSVDALGERRDAALTAHLAAMAAYEATPEGRETLTRLIATLEASGDDAGANAVRGRLVLAEERYEQQQQAFALATARARRLQTATPLEQDYLDEADGVVEEAEGRLGDAFSAVEDAQAALQATTAEFRAAAQSQRAATAAQEAASVEVAEATTQAQTAIARLYRDAGIAERTAGFYARDCALNAAGVPFEQQRHHSGPIRARGPLQVKVKRTGPDAEAMAAARDAAAGDADLTAAHDRLVAAQAALLEAADARAEADATFSRTSTAQHAARVRFNEAEAAVGAAEQVLSEARDRRRRARAAVAAGAGVYGRETPIEANPDNLRRNPNGSTNVWVYQPPSPGFEDGCYLAVIGVGTTHEGGAASNTLILEDGQQVSVLTHRRRTVRGAETVRTGPDTVLVAPPWDHGSMPLRAEGIAGAGFASYLDTSD